MFFLLRHTLFVKRDFPCSSSVKLLNSYVNSVIGYYAVKEYTSSDRNKYLAFYYCHGSYYLGIILSGHIIYYSLITVYTFCGIICCKFCHDEVVNFCIIIYDFLYKATFGILFRYFFFRFDCSYDSTHLKKYFILGDETL